MFKRGQSYIDAWVYWTAGRHQVPPVGSLGRNLLEQQQGYFSSDEGEEEEFLPTTKELREEEEEEQEELDSFQVEEQEVTRRGQRTPCSKKTKGRTPNRRVSPSPLAVAQIHFSS